MDLLSKLLKKMRELAATDLLIHPHTPPAFRVNGKLLARDDAHALNTGQIEQMAQLVLDRGKMAAFKEDLEINVGIAAPAVGRFRVNVYRQRGETSMAIRAIPRQIPSLRDLGLPEHIAHIVMQKRGLILVAGKTGSGKSTTLAAMLQHRSAHDSGHIITIEDPIEYELCHQRSVVSQREIGVDTHSYDKALRNALRQSPDVLMIGDVRDRATMDYAIEFADSAHLCLTSLHARNAMQAFERITAMYGANERECLMHSLAQNLRAIISQRLIPGKKGQRILAYELLQLTPHIYELIRSGRIAEIPAAMEKSNTPNVRTFDHTLFQLYQDGHIDEQTALDNAASVNNLRLRLKLSNKKISSGRSSQVDRPRISQHAS